MPSLFTELRRRNVFKVGAAYAIVAWLLVQVVDVVLPALQMPEWTISFVTVLLIIGFPITLIMAWAFEMTPEGIKPDADVPRDSITPATGQRLNYVILGLVVLAVGFLVTDQYVLDEGTQASLVGLAVSTPTVPEPAGSTPIPSSAPSTAQVQRFVAKLDVSELVGDTGLSAHVAISPDGNGFVYSAQVDGNTQLYYRNLDQFEAHPLPGTDGAHNPFFSPDGQWVGFYSDQTDQALKKVGVRGGIPQTLADGAIYSSGGSWATDGTIFFGHSDANAGRGLFRIPEVGGTPEPLLVSDSDKGYVTPHVLPGNDAILFVIRDGPGGAGNAREGRIAVLTLATGETEILIEGGFKPQYAPTGHIVFVRAGALWAVPFDAERLEKTGPEVPILDGIQSDGFRGFAPYAFSDEGLLVYVPGVDSGLDLEQVAGRDLLWVDREGREEVLEIKSRRQVVPRLSPDGQRLAVSINGGNGWDVWILDLTRGTSSRLTFEPSALPKILIWAADSDRVIFSTGFGMRLAAADGTGRAEAIMPSLTPQTPVSLSLDGGQLAYVEGQELHLLLMEGERESRSVLRAAPSYFSSAISPDSNWVAYESNETGSLEIYVRPWPNVDDGKWQVSTAGGEEPLWAPDGQELFYRDDLAMMAVSVGTEPTFSVGIPKILFEGSYDSSIGPSYDVSRDGQRFLMLRLTNAAPQLSDEASLLVVYNWFEELKRLAPPSP